MSTEFTDDEVRTLKALVAFMGGGRSASSAAAGTNSAKSEAEDSELDGRFGDPSVRKKPKRWAGEDMTGRKFSECPSDFLICLAEFLEWGADMDAKKPDPPKHNNGTPWFEYARKDARLARGWARRNQGLSPKLPATTVDDQPATSGAANVDAFDSSENDIPF